MITSKVLNVSAALNDYLDTAKLKCARLIEVSKDPANNVNPATIGALDKVDDALRDADNRLESFARANGFDLP